MSEEQKTSLGPLRSALFVPGDRLDRSELRYVTAMTRRTCGVLRLRPAGGVDGFSMSDESVGEWSADVSGADDENHFDGEAGVRTRR